MKVEIYRLENPVDLRQHLRAKELPARPGERVFLATQGYDSWELREAVVVSDTRAGRSHRWYRTEDALGYPHYSERAPAKEYLSVADFRKKMADEELDSLDNDIKLLRSDIKYDTQRLKQLLKKQAKLKGKK